MTKKIQADTKTLIVYDQLKDQYALTVEQARLLIRSETQTSDVAIINAINTAKMLGVPLQGVNLIRDQVYINSDGIRWLVANDPRKVHSIKTDIVHRTTKDEQWYEVKCIITFENGAEFDGYGAAMVAGKWTPADTLMKAETKAERRAGYKATGKVLPNYDDFIEYREDNWKEVKVTVTEKVPTTLVELITMAQTQYHWNVPQLLVFLGLTDMNEIKTGREDLAETWNALKIASSNGNA